MQEIEQAIRLSIWSPFVKNERGVSIMLIAPPEHGKTEVIKKFSFIESVHATADFNTFVFAEYASSFSAGKLRTILIPDFLRVVSKKYNTQSNCLTIMNSITEEGWVGKLPLGQTIDKPIHANIITSLTSDSLKDKRRKWASMGFLSRFVPLTFSYKETTKENVRSYIQDRVYHTDEPYVFDVPRESKDVLLRKQDAENVLRVSKDIMIAFGMTNYTGFRLQRQLQGLCMANALSNGRNMTTDQDVETIRNISKFINFDFQKI